MTQIVKDTLMDVGKSVAGVSVAYALDVPKRLDFGDSFVMRNGSNGILYALISDVIDGVSGEGSKIMNADAYGMIDDVLYLGAVSAATDISKMDGAVFNILNKEAKLSRNTAELVTESAVLSAGRIAGRLIDETPGVPPWLSVIRHPTRIKDL